MNNWIASAVGKPGALHRALGVPEGTPISKSQLEKAANSSNSKVAKEARLAITLKGFNKGGTRG